MTIAQSGGDYKFGYFDTDDFVKTIGVLLHIGPEYATGDTIEVYPI